MTKLDNIIFDITKEFIRAEDMWGSFNSLHEAYAIILEEVDELWKEVKRSQKKPDFKKWARTEAIQVAAMAIRLIYDCIDQ